MFRVTLSADFDSEAEAEAALSDLHEVVGKHDGSVEADDVEDLDSPS